MRKRHFSIGKIIGVGLFFILALGPLQKGEAAQESRYVSSSGGNDQNDGFSAERPWKTLAKVNQQTFGPGTTIYLKRGDTWNEALIPRGSGDFGSGRWITVKPYGPADKAKPTLDRANASDANKDWAVKLVDNQAWRLEDLIVRNSKTGFVYLGTNERIKKQGLQILRCEFYNIRGLPNHAKTPEEDKRTYWWARGSSGISITGYGYCKDGLPPTDANCTGDKGYYVGSYGPGLSDVTMEDVRVENAVYGIWIWGGGFTGGHGTNYQIRNPIILRAGVGGFELSFVKNALVENLRVQDVGGDSCWSGTFGVDVNYAEKVEFKAGEITGTNGQKLTDGEGTGFNLNGPNDVTVTEMKIYQNGGPAFATQGNPAPDVTKIKIHNNVIYGNGWLSDDPTHGRDYPEFALFWNPDDRETWADVRNNRIELRPGKRNLMAVVKGPVHLITNVLKNDMAMPDDRLAGSFFCGNRDISKSKTNPPLIPGNRECAG